MNAPDIVETLKQMELTSRLSEAQLERVRRHSHITDLLEGESLFFQGDDTVDFYYVISGRIKLFRLSPDGKEKVVAIMEDGATFAEALMFMSEHRYPVTATALTSARVIGINCADFKAMLLDSVETCFLLLGSMSQRMRYLIREIDALSLETGTMRTVSYLLQQAPPDSSSFDLTIAKSVIASRLSVKPETFSRILKNLQDQNIISIEGKHVTIHDRETMLAASDSGRIDGGSYCRFQGASAK